VSFTIKKLEKSERSRDRVEQILWTLDSDYVPPLSAHLDISLYAVKLINYAAVFMVEMDSLDAGILAIYANDIRELRAFISTSGVCQSARGHGIAGGLIDAATTYAREVGMLRVGLEVSRLNAPAIKLYRKFGFQESQSDMPRTYSSSVIMEKSL